MSLDPCPNDEVFAQLLEESKTQPVVLFKHSTRCPISGAAYREMEKFTAEHPDVPCGIVLVVEDRPLSQHITEVTGVPHQSPQALVLSCGKVACHVSHYTITCRQLAEACDAAKE